MKKMFMAMVLILIVSSGYRISFAASSDPQILALNNVTTTSISTKFTCKTSEAGKIKLFYGTSLKNMILQAKITSQKGNNFVLYAENLKPSTEYYYSVTFIPDVNKKSASFIKKFTTLISQIEKTKILNFTSTFNESGDEAKILINTNKSCKIEINYGDTKNIINKAEATTFNTLNHMVYIKNLIPGKTYYYQIVAIKDAEKVKSEVISIYKKITEIKTENKLKFTKISSYSTTSSSTKFEVSTSLPANVEIYYNNQNILDKSINLFTENKFLHLNKIDGLLPETKYYFQAVAKDENGNILRSEIFNFTTVSEENFKNIEVTSFWDNQASIKTSSEDYKNVQINYGTTQEELTSGSQLTSNSGIYFKTVLDNLKPNQNYYYKLVGFSPNDTKYESKVYSFITPNTIEFKAYTIHPIDAQTALVYVETNIKTDVVLITETANYPLSTTNNINHYLVLKGLSPEKKYSYMFNAQSKESKDYFIKSLTLNFSTADIK